MPSVRDLDRRIEKRHLLKHPFYTAWSRGELTLPILAEYARQYYHFERNFPRFVAGAYARQTDPARRTLLENLVDEEGRDPTHPELWTRFAESLGVSRRSLSAARIPGPASALCGTYEALTVEGTSASALGALYAYESIFPAVAAEKARGLREHYGITSKRAVEFFDVHVQADVEHSRAERKLLARTMERSPHEARQASKAVEEALSAWWTFLDAFLPARG